MAFRKSDQDGMGLDVARDNDAKNAMQLALYRLLDEEIELLKGKRLDKANLEARGCQVAEAMSWTALPSVTATGKAAVSPMRTKISGTDDCDDFEPCVAATGQSLKGVELDQIDNKAASVLDGYLVRKDLVRTFSRQFPVPSQAFPSTRRTASCPRRSWEDGHARPTHQATSKHITRALPILRAHHAGFAINHLERNPRQGPVYRQVAHMPQTTLAEPRGQAAPTLDRLPLIASHGSGGAPAARMSNLGR